MGQERKKAWGTRDVLPGGRVEETREKEKPDILRRGGTIN